jgi:hypothetical protein
MYENKAKQSETNEFVVDKARIDGERAHKRANREKQVLIGTLARNCLATETPMNRKKQTTQMTLLHRKR